MILEELIIFVLQWVFELLFNLVVYFPWDIFLFWRERKAPADRRESDYWLVPLGGAFFGGLLGAASLVFLPTTLLRHEVGRLINLIATPLISAALSRLLAQRRVKRGQDSDANLHFWFAFAFSLALLTVRFIWANRPS